MSEGGQGGQGGTGPAASSSGAGAEKAAPEGGGASGGMKRAWIVAFFSIATALLLVLFGKTAFQKASEFRRTEAGYRVFFTIPKTREPAPEFTLPTLDGKTVRLSSLRGRVVFLTFRTTW